MKTLSIGQMAKCNGVSTQTLRLYDRMGLLKPNAIDEQNGYRYYDIRQSACLDMIQYMKALGISLKEIKKTLDENDIEVISDILSKRLTEIDIQIEALNVTKGAVKNMISPAVTLLRTDHCANNATPINARTDDKLRRRFSGSTPHIIAIENR